MSGNRYVVTFVDYLTNWLEAFAIPDQLAETIARLLCEQIICGHGTPEQLLSDRGANFLTELILEICKVLGVKKLNTSRYHLQTDGLIEQFNSTLTNMIAKSCESRLFGWDQQLPFLLFAYHISAQESMKDSPFFLLHGQDARVPTESTLSFQRSPYVIDYDDYKEELMDNLSSAWENVQKHIATTQSSQKHCYDQHRSADENKVRKGDRVMIFMPIKNSRSRQETGSSISWTLLSTECYSYQC